MQCKDAVCVLHLISMLIIHKGLKLLYTGLGMAV